MLELKQLVLEPTRLNSILDLFCTTKPGLIKNVSLIPGISDHDGVIIVDTLLKAVINKKATRRIPVWTKADWDAMKKEASSFCETFLQSYSNRSVEENWQMFKGKMKTILDNVPSKLSSTRYNLPWLTTEVKRMIRKKKRAYNKAKNGNEIHRAKFKRLQNATRDALRKSHWNYVNSMLQEGIDTGDNKKFWRYMKAQRQDSQGVAPLKDGSRLLSDSLSKARKLGAQFSSVFTKDTPESSSIRKEGPNYPPIPDLNITTDGVQKLLMELNPGKASGPDEMPARLLKNLASEIAPVLTAIFKQSISTGALPSDWTKALISPVFKKGNRSDPANYRPVSLTCISCKLMEHVLCTHIRSHLDRHGIITPVQHGFRSKHSTETQLLITTHELLKERDAGKQIDVVVLDFSKAFDTVPHKRLLGKLELYGITGNIHKWISGFLSGRKQSVVVDGAISDEETVLSGVPLDCTWPGSFPFTHQGYDRST